MSQVFIIKCISCKGEFDQGDSYKRICEKCITSMRKLRIKINNAKKQPLLKKQPILYTRQCLACDSTFITKMINKQFCFHSCIKRYNNFPNQLVNTERMMCKLEEKIEKSNLYHEAQIIKIEKHLEKINYDFETQRIVYEKRLEFLRSKV